MHVTSAAGTAILAGTLLTGLAACAGGQSGGPAPGASASAAAPTTGGHAQSGLNTSMDPCALLTADDVAKAVKMKVDSTKADSSVPGTRGCTWTTAAGDAGAGADFVASVTAEVTGPPPPLTHLYPTARSYYDYLRKLYSDAKDVPGIGDSAFLTHKDHWIFAVKGNVVMRVFATFGTASTDRAVIEELMKDAMSRV